MEKHQSRRESTESPHELHKKYADLPGSPEVSRVIERDKVARTKDLGYREPKSKDGRIDAYLQFLEDRFSSDDIFVMGEDGDEHAGEILEIREQHPLQNEAFRKLKETILARYTMQIADEATLTRIAEGLYASEKKQAIERGMGAQIPVLEGNLPAVIARYKTLILEKHDIQKKTLASWLDYLQENDAKQPMWFRYIVVRSLEKMGTLDKERLDYSKRTTDTVAPFPELNSEALGWVYLQMLKFKEEGLDLPTSYLVPDEETQERKDQILNAIRSKDFAKLYAFAQVETAGKFDRESLIGEWKKYPKGSDPGTLEHDIKGKGTGWCTAEGSAQGQLKAGDFYVYFTNNQAGAPTEPRIAIRMERNQVAEVRGVYKRQSLEPELLETAQGFYKDLPGGDKYDKKAFDMSRVTALTVKQQKGDALDKDDLLFLYEINAPIEGFDLDNKDSRIADLLKERNPEADMLTIFECDSSQIARSVSEINESTKAYVGKLEPGIFAKIADHNIEYICTAFPEKKIRRIPQEAGGRTLEDMKSRMRLGGHKFWGEGEFMADSDDFKRSIYTDETFTSLKPREMHQLVRLTVKDLGFPDGASYSEIVDHALKFGLDLCSPEDALEYRISYTDQPMGECVGIGMKPISGRARDPHVFYVLRGGRGSLLGGSWASPGSHWDAGGELVFRLPSETL